MCGIVGYVGARECAPILLEGLRRLEYRGYDSAGLAVQNGTGLQVRKLAGRVKVLGESLRENPMRGSSGLAHTRGATHGPPTQPNAHPHTDCSGRFALSPAQYVSITAQSRHSGHLTEAGQSPGSASRSCSL